MCRCQFFISPSFNFHDDDDDAILRIIHRRIFDESFCIFRALCFREERSLNFDLILRLVSSLQNLPPLLNYTYKHSKAFIVCRTASINQFHTQKSLYFLVFGFMFCLCAKKNLTSNINTPHFRS